MTATRSQQLLVLCDVAELIDGEVRTAYAGRARLGMVLDRGAIKVFFGGCPHHGGPLDRGSVRPSLTAETPGQRTVAPDAPVLVCPWHNYEFDLETGCAVADRTLCLHFIPHEIHGEKVCVIWPPSR